jgi:hypothetical protein
VRSAGLGLLIRTLPVLAQKIAEPASRLAIGVLELSHTCIEISLGRHGFATQAKLIAPPL